MPSISTAHEGLVSTLNDLIATNTMAEAQVLTEFDRLLSSGDLKKKMFQVYLNPSRPGRPRLDGERGYNFKTNKLNKECEQEADKLIGSISIVRNQGREMTRALNAIMTNFDMLMAAYNKTTTAHEEFRTSTKQFLEARKSERELKEKVGAHPSLDDSSRKVNLMAKKKAKKVTAKKSEKKTSEKVSDLSQAEKDRRIKALQSELTASDDKAEKSRIRARLRSLGHTGGSNQRSAAGEGKTSKKKTSKKKVSKKSGSKKSGKK